MSSTANERIITLLRKPYPRWHVCTDFGEDYHSLATRICHLNKAGWDIKSRKSTQYRFANGRAKQEYRMGSFG